MEIQKIIEKFSKKLPKFDDGRINYKDSKEAPVLNIFVKYKDKVLFLKRSNKVLAYKGKWNSVAGFLDELRPVEEKVLEELKEETGIDEGTINEIKINNLIKYNDNEINRTWLIVPVLVTVHRKPKIKVDWEHSDFVWIKPEDIGNLDFVSGLDDTLNKVLK